MRHLIPYLEEYAVDGKHTLFSLLLQKTGITDNSAVALIPMLEKARLRELNLSSNQLSFFFFEKISEWLAEGPHLQALDLSNNKISDKSAIPLVHAVIEKSRIRYFNLSRNQVGFKTGNYVFALLMKNKEAAGRQLPLQVLNLNYNNISHSLNTSIQSLIQSLPRNNSTSLHRLSADYPLAESSKEGADYSGRYRSISPGQVSEAAIAPAATPESEDEVRTTLAKMHAGLRQRPKSSQH